MRYRWTYIATWALLLTLLTGCHRASDQGEKAEIDALNTRAYHYRYVDIDSVRSLSLQALQRSDGYADGRNEALNNLAFVEYQQMNFDGVDSILTLIYSDSHNQLLRLGADVMQMKKAQRVGDGARFFRVKSSAERRMFRIAEELDELTEREMGQLVYAQTEFHIITSTYYFYQEQDSMAQAELAKVLPCLDAHVDTAQWVYYNYMLGPGGLVQGENDEDIALKEFDYLFRAYSLSHRTGMIYFEANCLQAFATMYLHRGTLLARQRPEAHQVLLTHHLDWLAESDDLSLALARHALVLFQTYNDLFQTACTYRTLGEIYFERGDYNQALDCYVQALHCVNVHHLRYYGDLSPDTLTAFNPDALERSVEKEWIDDARISTVPEWIAGIRQQFSLTFSALGMKQASDYNRNFYLDLLQATNQNQELESRSAELRRQTKALYSRMALSLVMLVAVLGLFVVFRYRLKRQASDSIKEIRDALDYLSSGKMPSGLSPKEQQHLQPYHDFLEWNAVQLADLEEARGEVEESLSVSTQRVTENKRKNAENRAKVSLVHAIVPFLDRIGGEVLRMERTGSVEPERKAYIAELVERIETYNAILTDWIKMEQGQLNLHITTVSLEHLFHIVAEGHYAFDQKGIALRVEPTQLRVKADESLTLFMINTLADNARKFTPSGGTVTLSAQAVDDYVEIRVSDTGCGLTEEEVEILNHSKVYDASEIGQNKEGKGFGFGLMNCRGIIEKYKKSSAHFASCAFGVRSKVGEGSTFFFRLPRVVRLLLLLCLFPTLCHAGMETEYYDSVYQANVDGRYAEAVQYAEQVLDILNHTHPGQPPLQLRGTKAAHAEPADLQWAQSGVDADYALIVALRNEIALAALALHDWPLYYDNNRTCIRLHKFIHQDQTLPTYYSRLEQTHQNSNLLLVFILIAAFVILLLSYKLLVSRQVKIEQGIDELSHYCRHLLAVAGSQPTEAQFLEQTSDWPAMKDWAEKFQHRLLSLSVVPMNHIQEDMGRLQDEQTKLAYEENRLYVQNQVLDNCLSTIKHESMYYPSRIRILVENMKEADIEQLSELVHYYQHIYSLLCRQADAQVAQPGFKRQHVDALSAIQRAEALAHRVAKRQKITITCCAENRLNGQVSVLADEILLDMLFESLLQGMLYEGGTYVLRCEEDEGFVRYTLCDPCRQLTEDDLANLFYPESRHTSYLVAKQILREHDTYANHPGCRLNAVQAEQGYAIYFTLRKTKS